MEKQDPEIEHTSGKHPEAAFDGVQASWSERAVRPLYVLRYYRKRQIFERLRKIVRQRILGQHGSFKVVRDPQLREGVDLSALVARRYSPRRVEAARRRAAGLRNREFSFLNETRQLAEPIDWQLEQAADASHLWRFHLHYQDYVTDLAIAATKESEPRYATYAWSLVEQWIDENFPDAPSAAYDSWHPFCISRRLMNWVLLWTASPPPQLLVVSVTSSIAAQAQFLSRHLELDLRGNHLLENLRALAIAGTFLSGPTADAWLKCVQKLLPREVDEQILPHGEHFERSPMYHAAMLEAILDIRDSMEALAAARNMAQQAINASAVGELAGLCRLTAIRMAEFLEDVLHPDGNYPLLGDSAFDDQLDPQTLISAARGDAPVQPASTDHETAANDPVVKVTGDYWSFRRGDDFLLFDAAPVGADHLPAHAHADLLTIEGSIDGHRLIVDSGVFNYEGDAMRRYCRSTAAHNTPTIDGRDQCDIWSKFRMGYRGWPRAFASGSTRDLHWARAAHDAYRRYGVRNLWRWISANPSGTWICVDWLDSPDGRHEFTNRLHFHPEASVTELGPCQFRIHVGDQELALSLLGARDCRLEDSWYCPQFGQRLESKVLVWQADDHRATGWILARDSRAADRASLSLRGPEPELEVMLDGEVQTLRLAELSPSRETIHDAYVAR